MFYNVFSSEMFFISNLPFVVQHGYEISKYVLSKRGNREHSNLNYIVE